MNAYAEASGIGGGPAALAQGLSPLDGILTPTLGAYDLAITLLLPFVVIRLIASEKSSDALKLMLQWPASIERQIAAKVIALIAAWIVSLLPFFIALALWRGYGGHLFAPEVLKLLAGYTLRFLLTAALAIGLVLMLVRVSFDVSENRRNSFSPSDERALSSIHAPLTITVFLSSEDPRMMDFENNVLVKLRRSMRNVTVIYPLAGRSGLFENDARYGTIEYRLGTKSTMSRSTTDEIVLDTIYELDGV